MTSSELFLHAVAAERFIRPRIGDPPTVAVVLGSGLGPLADRLINPKILPYEEIPHFAIPTVAGHAGNLIVGAVGSARVLYLQGRFHFYEGHDLSTVTFFVRVLQRLGVKTLVLTAATGSINPTFVPGDIVGISDHLNLIGMNPLRGRHDDRLGLRFPDMSEVYSRRLRAIAATEASTLGIDLKSGVLRLLPGP